VSQGRHARLLAPHARRTHRISGNADDAVVFAENPLLTIHH
jgi:hypothetical protein